MTIAHQFAEFLTGTSAIGETTLKHVKAALFDLTIAAVAGFDTRGAQAARSAARRTWGTGPARVWLADECLSVPGAAFANSAAASMLDLDDGHRAAAGHPGASIIPAVLATISAHDNSDERVFTAIALGYEIAVRVAASRDFAALTTMVSGPWVGQGAAAAAAWLRSLDPSAVTQAIAIAGASAPNLAAVGYSRVMGNHLKEGIPWATATGLAAVDLAAAGFTGPTDLLDNAELFDSSKLLSGLGMRWAIEGIYFKPYSCCRWAHAAIDAVLALKAEHAFVPDDIGSIEVQTFGWALRLNNETAPLTLESAQYSVPFCVALAATRGSASMVQLSEATLKDRETLALARRVTLSVDPQFERMFPDAVPSRVIVETAKGRFERTVTAPLGEPTNPLDWTALEKKFTAIADGVALPAPRQELLMNAVRRLKTQNELGPLVLALAEPLGRDRTASISSG
jgi:2-methylcitrate dehydratase PrpD